MSCRIGFAGPDGRTLESAIVTSYDQSQTGRDGYHGVVIRGMPAMPEFAKIMHWPITFIPTAEKSVGSYASAIVQALRSGAVDYVLPMPEDLFYEGLVDRVTEAGLGDRIAGLAQAGSFIEGDKIACKRFCQEFDIPVADEWHEVDARNYQEVLEKTLKLIDQYGGAVMKYPYSAAGKGSRIVRDAWQIRKVYDSLMADYGKKTEDGKDYVTICGKDQKWPLLLESFMAGVEISFTVLVDKKGDYQILPTALDYPERFPGPAGIGNPITGGMGSISPHPLETKELMEMAGEQIIKPFIKGLKAKGLLRPCVLYPGCIISLDRLMKPVRIRKCEMNQRMGEPETQPVLRETKNPGQLIKAMFEGNLSEVTPEVRRDQLSLCLALVTGPGGPDGQKGYPWTYTKGEPAEIDFRYFDKNRIQLIPAGLGYNEAKGGFISDGTRIIYMNVNGALRAGETMADVASRLRDKLLAAYDGNKIRVIPRENPHGNRLDLRRDIGEHYLIAEITFLDITDKLRSALGRKVKIVHSADNRTATGMLTGFDQGQFEAELDHTLRIGTQVIHSVTILS